MRILVTGARGQLGWELARQAPGRAVDCVGIDLAEADITDPAQVERVIAESHPDLLINCAAYTGVDTAESDSAAAFAVNRDAAAHLAGACTAAGIPLVHISTDFIFDGRKTEPYMETDPVAPIGVYGRSKAAGEEAVRQTLDRHLIIRTAWLYGVHGGNFVKAMLGLGRKNNQVRVVADQVGCPTFAGDLAAGLLTLCRRVRKGGNVPWGTYHLCGQGAVSWHGFARCIFEIANRLDLTGDVAVAPITTEDYPTAASRPAFSALSCRKIHTAFGIALPPWQASLEQMLIRLSRQAKEMP